jgi:large subunit ribosomal protein L6
LSLGYSHQIFFPLPTGISVEVEKMTKVFVRGADKELVGQTAAKIRSFRPPEPYKGSIHYPMKDTSAGKPGRNSIIL